MLNRTALVLAASIITACGTESAAVSVREAMETDSTLLTQACAGVVQSAKATRAQVGITHVAGRYVPASMNSGSFLMAGADAVKNLGASSIKVYLTPNFAEKYPDLKGRSFASTLELAQSEDFKALFSGSFSTYFITTYAFSTAGDHHWTNELRTSELQKEVTELESLVTYLLTTYAGTGKTFVIQNWEGDWALLNGFDPSAEVPAARAQRMATWMNARQMAVNRARETVKAAGVQVLNAIEVNRVLDTSAATRVVNAVLPNTCVDAVSYSAWEALEPSLNRSMTTVAAKASVDSLLGKALSRIESSMRGTPMVFLGEAGFAENRAPSADRISSLIEQVLTTADAHGVSHVVYWQIFDNECDANGASCPGFWLVKPDGSLSAAGQFFNRLLNS